MNHESTDSQGPNDPVAASCKSSPFSMDRKRKKTNARNPLIFLGKYPTQHPLKDRLQCFHHHVSQNKGSVVSPSCVTRPGRRAAVSYSVWSPCCRRAVAAGVHLGASGCPSASGGDGRSHDTWRPWVDLAPPERP